MKMHLDLGVHFFFVEVIESKGVKLGLSCPPLLV